jgi:DNA-binding winged helix-turn-helix (wHTH) protein/TolB-like protein
VEGDFRIRGWLIQPQLRVILSPQKRMQVEPKVMRVLVKLAERPGEVVSKEELLKDVWAGTHVTEGVLTRAISELRKILEDGPRQKEVIQTIPRSGYRLLATPEAAEAPAVPSNPPSRPKSLNWLFWLGVLGIAFSVILPLLIRVTQSPSSPPFPAGIDSVAVLPFKNLSGATENDSFANFLTDSLIGNLARMEHCRIATRESVARSWNPTKTVHEMTRELDVDAAIVGTVFVVENSVRITANLVVPTGRVLWSGDYDQVYDQTLILERKTLDALSHDIQAVLAPRKGNKDR